MECEIESGDLVFMEYANSLGLVINCKDEEFVILKSYKSYCEVLVDSKLMVMPKDTLKIKSISKLRKEII
jgi:hypothetical protein